MRRPFPNAVRLVQIATAAPSTSADVKAWVTWREESDAGGGGYGLSLDLVVGGKPNPEPNPRFGEGVSGTNDRGESPPSKERGENAFPAP